jgi:cell division protein FtsI (penicillin-binding protein 3)
MLPRTRMRVLAFALAVWAGVVWLRLAQVQVLQHASWEAAAARQRESTIEVEEPRGDIVTADGHILAGSLERAVVYANPSQIPRAHWAEVAKALAPIVGITPEAILQRFQQRDRFFYLARDLDPGVAAEVDKLRERGIGTLQEEKRVHPHGPLAAALLGFVNAEGVGQAGLEKAYERTLAGTPSVYRLLRDGKALPTPLDLKLDEPGRPGLSLRLTIDSRVQLAVEEELQRTIDHIGARDAAAVVMDPYTGELLALASLPSYNPDHPGDSPPATWRNRAVEDAIEPGSTFKPVVVSAALAAGILRPLDLVDCSGGGVEVAGVFIHDHASYGLLTVRQVIAQSSNAGAIRIAQRLQPGQLDGMIRAFGFGRPTGIELPAETGGLYSGPEHWSLLSPAGLALGQEITASPLQMAQAYSIIANGGLLVRPTLVRETMDQSGAVVTPNRPVPPHRVLPTEVAREVADMLEAVVQEGTGRTAEVAGFRAAGKTGTAQKAGAHGFSGGRHAAWFAGFLTLPRPRVVIVVCVDEPKATYWASDVAAPAFAGIAERLVGILGISPSEGVRL